MGRKPHPLEVLNPTLKADTSTTAKDGLLYWSAYLINTDGDKYGVTDVQHRIPDTEEEWTSFWYMVDRRLQWSKNLLTAAPIVRLIISPDLQEYICAIPTYTDFKHYFSDYPTIENSMQDLSRDDFAALQHLCKIKYHRMRLGH